MIDMDKVVFRGILQKINYHIRKPTKGKKSGRDSYIKKLLILM